MAHNTNTKPFQKKGNQSQARAWPAGTDLKVVTVYSVTVDGRKLLTGEKVAVWENKSGRWVRTAHDVRINVLRFTVATEAVGGGKYETHLPIAGRWVTAAKLASTGEMGLMPVGAASPEQHSALRFDSACLRPSPRLGVVGGDGYWDKVPYPKWEAGQRLLHSAIAAKETAPDEPSSAYVPYATDNRLVILNDQDIPEEEKDGVSRAIAAALDAAGVTVLEIEVPAPFGDGEILPGWVTESTAASDAAFADGLDNRDTLLGKNAAW